MYSEYVLLRMTYGSETWVITEKMIHKMQLHQKASEKNLLKISLKYKKTGK